MPLRAEEVRLCTAPWRSWPWRSRFVFMGPVVAIAVAVGLTFRRRGAGVSAAPPAESFTKQLPDTLNLLRGTLRAGFSLMQGIEAIASEVGDPMGVELRRVLAEARLGRPLDGALSDMATRLRSPDFEWAVMAIGIQREVGGNLAELLENVAETMRARERLRRDVKALTAEGRMSAIVIGIMPPGSVRSCGSPTGPTSKSCSRTRWAKDPRRFGSVGHVRLLVDEEDNRDRGLTCDPSCLGFCGSIATAAYIAFSHARDRESVRSSLRRIEHYEIEAPPLADVRSTPSRSPIGCSCQSCVVRSGSAGD